MVVHVIVDASGSMVEDSKHGVVKYILVGMEHVNSWPEFSNCEYKVYQIGEKTGYIGTLDNYEKIVYGGTVKEENIQNIQSHIHSEDRVILLSDGNMELSVRDCLKKACNHLLCIGIGADIDRSTLKRLSDSKKVYNATDYIEVMGLMR